MKIFDPKLTGSIEILNEITGDVTMSANLLVEGNLSGNITGSASTASYIELSNVDGSASLASRIFDNSSSIASLEAVSGSYANSSSFASDISTNSSSIASLETVSGSYANSSSFASDISSNSASIGSLNAVSSSYLLNTTDTLTGDLTVTGNIIATTLNVQDVTASVVYSSGSNIFGSSSIDTQQFTGSILTSGSIEVNGDKFTVSGATGNATFAGDVSMGKLTATKSGTAAVFNSGTTNVVASFTSTDGTGVIQLADSGGNVEIGASGNNFVVSPAGGVAQLTVGSSSSTFAGNVGIGVDPTSPLTIKSNSTSTASSGLIIQANSSTNSIVRLGERSNGRARLEMLDSGVTKIAFYTDGNNNYINAGNVGIGTDSPDNILHIRKGDTTYDTQVGADTMLFLETTNVSNALQFTSANTGQQYIMFGDDDPNVGWISYNHSDNNLNFRVNGSERMRINNSGLVSIKNVGVPTLRLENTDTSLGVQTLGSLEYYQSDPSATGVGVVSRINCVNESGFQGAGALTFETGDVSSITERLRINSSGNATFAGDVMPAAENLYDIGSASVRWEDIWADQVYGRSLYVDDNIYHSGDTDTYIAFTADRQTYLAGGDEFIDFREATESYITLGNSNDTDAKLIGGAGYIFIQGSNGYIGINDATPSYPFQVSANTVIEGTLTVTSTVTTSTGAEIRSSDGTGIRLRNAANSANEGGFCRSGYWEGNSSRDPSLFAETGLGLRFYTGGSANKKFSIDSAGISEFKNDGTTASKQNSVIRLSGGGAANGYTLINDTYTATESQLNIGLGYSGSPVVISQNCKVSATVGNQYLSSNAQGNTRPQAFLLDAGDFVFKNTQTSATRAVDSVVALDERMRIADDGKVSIGERNVYASGLTIEKSGNHLFLRASTSTAGKYWNFDVASTNRLYIINNGNTGVYINDGDTSWTGVSDETLKENIKPLENVLDKIKDYRCVEYNLKSDKTKDKKIGFIAQDWENDFAPIVNKDDEGLLGMKYTETIPVLLKAIQELKAEIEILKNK